MLTKIISPTLTKLAKLSRQIPYASFVVPLVLALAGCRPESSPPTPPASNGPKTYAVHGVVQEVSPDQHRATIKHEAIPGFMGAMTMDFPALDTNVLKGISAGDEISFTLAVTETNDWIENVQVVGKTNVPLVSGPPGWHVQAPSLSVGDALPDYEFTDENGQPVRLSDFRGQVVAFTFFFTTCALPDFCVRMNRNFSEARKILLADTNAPTNWQLLSISFDPSFDTPAMLTGYAKYYRGESTNRWLFAVASTNTLAKLAPQVDLSFWREDGTFSHNLRTVVLDSDGKIFAQLDSNGWTPEQLAAAIMAAGQKK